MSNNLEELKNKIDNEPYEVKQELEYAIYNELIFMQNTLTTLKKEINKNGVIENFKNGKQDFIRESQALKSYNNTIKNYNKCIKDLISVIDTRGYIFDIDN